MALCKKSKGSKDVIYSNHIDMVYFSGSLEKSRCMNPSECAEPCRHSTQNLEPNIDESDIKGKELQ